MSTKNKPDIKIWNAGEKFYIPVSKKVLISREDMQEVLPEYTKLIIKWAVKEWINTRKKIERYLEKKAIKSGIVLSYWKKYTI